MDLKTRELFEWAYQELVDWEKDQGPYGTGGYDVMLPQIRKALDEDFSGLTVEEFAELAQDSQKEDINVRRLASSYLLLKNMYELQRCILLAQMKEISEL